MTYFNELGAGDFNYSDAGLALAKSALTSNPSSGAGIVVTLGPDGSKPAFSFYPDVYAAASAYDKLRSDSGISWGGYGNRAGVLASANPGLVGESRFGVDTTTTTTMTKWKNAMPWILAGGAVIAAAVYFTRGTSKKKAPARKRRSGSSSSWRRRVVTTWR